MWGGHKLVLTVWRGQTRSLSVAEGILWLHSVSQRAVVYSLVCVCVCATAAYMTTPCHIEMILTERDEAVPKAEEEKKKKVSKKKLKREKMRAAMTGGD